MSPILSKVQSQNQEWVTDGEREGEREAAKVGQREMDLLAQVGRRRAWAVSLAAVIISKGQKGIRRRRRGLDVKAR